MTNSEVLTAAYVITQAGQAARPTAAPAAGNYTTAQTVTLTSATVGTDIYYTTDGTTPATTSTRYTTPISISATTTLKAIAVKSGMSDSAVITAVYTITQPGYTAEPTATPAAGNYTAAQTVTLTSATAGADIHYTTDGTTPATTSTRYTTPISISATTTLKAIAVKSGLADSTVMTAAYTITSSVTHTVSFNTNGGTAVTSLTVNDGDTFILPEAPTRAGHTFGGWYSNEALESAWNPSTQVYADITLYARWNSEYDLEDFEGEEVDQVFSVATASEWNTALTTIRDGGNDKNYVINITEDFSIAGSIGNTFSAVSELTVSIRGNETISLSSKGSALRISSGQTVIVRNVDFTGRTDNAVPLIYLSSGELTLRGDASVSDNTNLSSTTAKGGGIHVTDGALTLRDAANVSDNVVSVSGGTSEAFGGGVYVDNGTFTMEGSAVVSTNTVSSANYLSSGGGVHIASGTFAMRDMATVTYNEISSGAKFSYDYPSSFHSSTGGGVSVYSGTFTMEDDAAVSGNTASSGDSYYSSGGGIYISDGTFAMEDNAKVSGNKASTISSNPNGGGVYVDSNGIFIMHNSAAVSDNTTTSLYGLGSGGGVHVRGTFIMRDMTAVSDNTAYASISSSFNSNDGSSGGGVSVASSGTFIMRDMPTISGNTAYASIFSPPLPSTPFYVGGGGGVCIAGDGTFQMEGGTIYGSDNGDISNKLIGFNNVPFTDNGAALKGEKTGRIQYGEFSGDTFTSTGVLETTDDTIAK